MSVIRSYVKKMHFEKTSFKENIAPYKIARTEIFIDLWKECTIMFYHICVLDCHLVKNIYGGIIKHSRINDL